MKQHGEKKNLCIRTCCAIACRCLAKVRALCASWNCFSCLQGFRLADSKARSDFRPYRHTGPMEAKPTQMQQVWAITGGMLKKSLKWLVKTKTVEDKLFVEIDKWDRAFVPFVTGKPIQLKKEKELT